MSLHDTNALTDIRTHHLFAGLSPPQLQRLLSTAYIEEADSGQLLFDRGQPALHFYVVVEGQVNLVLYSKTGEEKIVDILGPGQSFAEAVMFMSGPVYPVLRWRRHGRGSRGFRAPTTSRYCGKARKPVSACSDT